MPRARPVTVTRPARTGRHDGLAYSLWLPPSGGIRPLRGGVVVLHGAGGVKERHHDYARVLAGAGFAALLFDARGHGESEGELDGRALDDVATMAALLRSLAGDPGLPVALRGSSMGGYFAIAAARTAGARAVVAICPAPAEGLVRGLRAGIFDLRSDRASLEALLTGSDLFAAVSALDIPLLIMHAEGDEQVPVELSRELIGAARLPESRLITPPGGHHTSVQHDEELQAVSVRFIGRALSLA